MKSGIYKIKNIINGKCYIGSSKHLSKRKKEHFSLLKRNKSNSRILQKAYNKYGEANFIFEIIAECPEIYLFLLEQWFVDTLKPEYNICIIDVSVPIGVKHKKYSDESKYKTLALERLKNNKEFGWKSQEIVKLDENNNIIKEYPSLKEYALEHKCSIANVGKALKTGNRCKGFYIKYKKNIK